MNSQLAGLEEKFRVLNNEEIADALQVRLEELSRRSDKWTPEVLSLLLHLSDQPAKNSKLEDLDLIKPQPLPTPLTWSDIIADDPLDNRDGLWDNVDFTADDSENDDNIALDSSSPVTSVLSSGFEDEDAEFDPEALIVSVDDAVIHDIVSAQLSRTNRALKDSKRTSDLQLKPNPYIVLTEAQTIREVIFMLLGLPTSIFLPTKDGNLSISPFLKSSHMSQDSIRHMLRRFTLLGSELTIIRRWLNREENLPLLETFQAALALRIGNVDNQFSKIEARMLDCSRNFTPSLLDVFHQTSHIARSMQQVAKILVQTDSSPKEQMPFRILELLYDAACENHSIGDAEGYRFMGTLFFDCFHTYLKPVRVWMENGDLDNHNQAFFVKAIEKQVAPSSLWQEQHRLVKNPNGLLYAPKFLHVAAKKIFTTGKSINFLKMLGQGAEDLNDEAAGEPALDYESVCGKEDLNPLGSFPELFDMALDKWITSKHRSSSHRLRHILEFQCGLRKSLEALEMLYFFKNGALSVSVATTIFNRMDRGIESWNNRFLLTELFQGVFGALTCIDIGRLTVRSSAGSYQDIQSRRRSMKVLTSLRISYSLPWPVANLIKQESIAVYQRIFIFLLQVQRAKHMLERQQFSKRELLVLDSKSRETHIFFSLRHRLLWFSNILLTYLTNMVLSAATSEMKENLATAEDVDGMIAVHEAYISRLEEQCLIEKRLAPIHQAIVSLLDLVILFSDVHASYTGQPILDLTNRSMISASGRQNISSKRRNRTDAEPCSSDDDEVDSNDDVADLSYISFTEIPYAERLLKMHATFSKLLNFVIAGLHGVHRAGGEPCWEIFADSLVAGVGKREKTM